MQRTIGAYEAKTHLPRLRTRLCSPASWPKVLLELPIPVEPVSLADAPADVTETSRRHDLPAYDASYLALAARRGLPLATVDGRLRAACAQSGIELVTE